MAKNSDVQIVSHTDARVWASHATDKFNILPNRVQAIHNLLFCQDREVCDEETGPIPELVTSLPKDERFKKAEVHILRHLHGTYYLARTFQLSPVVVFLVLDERKLGKVLFEFSWDVSYEWNQHVNRGAWFGSHWLNPQFDIKVNNSGNFVFLIGPQEKIDEDTFSVAKILDCQAWNIQDFEVYSREEKQPKWPVCVAFDPRQHKSHLVTMICTCQRNFVSQSHGNSSGTIVQYDLYNKQETQSLEHDMSSELLTYLKEGKHIMCMEAQDVQNEKRIYILDSDTLDGLIALDLNDIEFSTEWQTSSMHLLPLYSACYRYMSLVFWTRACSRWALPISDVVTFRLPYIGDKVSSLIDLTRSVLLTRVHCDKLGRLPLPTRLLNFLYGGEVGSIL